MNIQQVNLGRIRYDENAMWSLAPTIYLSPCTGLMLSRGMYPLLDYVMNHRRPRNDGRDRLRVVRVLQAAQQSRNRNGEPVDIKM